MMSSEIVMVLHRNQPTLCRYHRKSRDECDSADKRNGRTINYTSGKIHSDPSMDSNFVLREAEMQDISLLNVNRRLYLERKASTSTGYVFPQFSTKPNSNLHDFWT